ncbi:MAG: hypothetical protein KBS70_06930 [Bacteroidales bacterium]|nr:hypothetical protein [Candidatus Colicola equi]
MREKIAEALNRLGKSAYWLAKESGVAKPNIYTWLQGKNTISDDGVEKLRQALISAGATELRTESEEPYIFDFQGAEHQFQTLEDIYTWAKTAHVSNDKRKYFTIFRGTRPVMQGEFFIYNSQRERDFSIIQGESVYQYADPPASVRALIEAKKERSLLSRFSDADLTAYEDELLAAIE